MTVEGKDDIDGLKEIGKIVALTISEMKNQTRCRNDDQRIG